MLLAISTIYVIVISNRICDANLGISDEVSLL